MTIEELQAIHGIGSTTAPRIRATVMVRTSSAQLETEKKGLRRPIFPQNSSYVDSPTTVETIETRTFPQVNIQCKMKT